jgi:hypothetical protein
MRKNEIAAQFCAWQEFTGLSAEGAEGLSALCASAVDSSLNPIDSHR